MKFANYGFKASVKDQEATERGSRNDDEHNKKNHKYVKIAHHEKFSIPIHRNFVLSFASFSWRAPEKDERKNFSPDGRKH